VDPEKTREAMEAMRVLMRPGEHLTIEQGKSSVTLTGADGIKVTLPTDGKKVTVRVAELGEVEYKAKWTEGELEVERKVDGELKVKEIFSRSPGSPPPVRHDDDQGADAASDDLQTDLRPAGSSPLT
jgi:hypothetical protein